MPSEGEGAGGEHGGMGKWAGVGAKVQSEG